MGRLKKIRVICDGDLCILALNKREPSVMEQISTEGVRPSHGKGHLTVEEKKGEISQEYTYTD